MSVKERVEFEEALSAAHLAPEAIDADAFKDSCPQIMDYVKEAGAEVTSPNTAIRLPNWSLLPSLPGAPYSDPAGILW